MAAVNEISIVERIPAGGEYNHLRKAVGWKSYAEEDAARFLPNSLFGVCALTRDELVGMARVIGDGGLVFYIQDVIVVPEWQRRGVGTLLMDRVMAYIRQHAFEQSNVGLMSAKGKEPFYEKYGFVTRPTEALGAGMTIFWKGAD
ncbi:MAG: GNAT family N-acetyltransferase [Desulfuromonadaceae bacterium]